MREYTVSEFWSGDWNGLDKLENRLCRNIYAPKQARKDAETTTQSAIHPFPINKFIPVNTFIYATEMYSHISYFSTNDQDSL